MLNSREAPGGGKLNFALCNIYKLDSQRLLITNITSMVDFLGSSFYQVFNALRYNLFYILRENSVSFSTVVQKDHRSVSGLTMFLMKSFCSKCYITVLEVSLICLSYIEISNQLKQLKLALLPKFHFLKLSLF